MSDPVASTVLPAASEAPDPPDEPPGDMVEVPRVARDPPQLGVGERRAGELRRRGARVHHRAGREHAVDHRVRLLGHDPLLDEGALLEGAAGDRLLLLEHQRNPVERSHVATAGVPPLGLARRSVGLVPQLLGERVDGRLDHVRACEDGVEQLDRRELLAGEPVERVGGADPVQLGHEVEPIVAAQG